MAVDEIQIRDYVTFTDTNIAFFQVNRSPRKKKQFYGDYSLKSTDVAENEHNGSYTTNETDTTSHLPGDLLKVEWTVNTRKQHTFRCNGNPACAVLCLTNTGSVSTLQTMTGKRG